MQSDTKSTKAIVAAIVTMLGSMGVVVSDGTIQLIAAGVQLVLVTFGVWRAHNAPKRRAGRPFPMQGRNP